MSGVTQAADGRPSMGTAAPEGPTATAAASGPARSTALGDSAIKAALGGHNPAAREALIDYYGPLLAAFAEARGGSTPHDAASGVILSLLREPHAWPTGELALRTALFRALRLRLQADSALESDPSPGDVALRSLTEDQRDLVLLRAIGGLDLTQVGVVLDRPVHRVKSLQRESIDALGQATDGEQLDARESESSASESAGGS